MPDSDVANDEPVDALYRACKRYDELYGSPSDSDSYQAAIEHTAQLIQSYYIQRVNDGVYLPPPPHSVTDSEEWMPIPSEDMDTWALAIMDEISNWRNARG